MAATTLGPLPEEVVFRSGLAALRRALGDAELLAFQKRPNGTPLLLQQRFFERVLGGQAELLGCQAAEVAAAQGDVRSLSLPQLLFLRCANLEFSAQAPSMRVHGEFLGSVDEHLEKRLAAQLTGRSGVEVPPGQLAEVVRLVLLVYGASEQVDTDAAKSGRWLVRCGQLEAVLLLPACELHGLGDGDDEPTYCPRSLSRASAAVPKSKRQLHWEVELSSSPRAFDSAPPKSPQRRPRLNGARVSESGRRSLGGSSPAADREEDNDGTADGRVPFLRLRLSDAEESLRSLREELASAQAIAHEAAESSADISAAKAAAHDAHEELRKLRADFSKLQQQHAFVTSAEGKAVFKSNALRTELSITKESNEKLDAEVTALRAEVSSLKETNAELVSELSALRAELVAARAGVPLEAKAKGLVEGASLTTSSTKEVFGATTTQAGVDADGAAPAFTSDASAEAADETLGASQNEGELADRAECAKAEDSLDAEPSDAEACVLEGVSEMGFDHNGECLRVTVDKAGCRAAQEEEAAPLGAADGGAALLALFGEGLALKTES